MITLRYPSQDIPRGCNEPSDLHLGSNLGHIALYHDLHQFLERGGLGFQLSFAFALVGSPQRLTTLLDGRNLEKPLRGSCQSDSQDLLRRYPSRSHPCLPTSVRYLHDGKPTGQTLVQMLLTGSDDKVLWLFCLEDKPHTLYIVLCITPVTQRIQVAEIEFLLLTLFDAGCSKSNLAGNEISPRRSLS